MLITADLVILHFQRCAADSQASTTTQELINQQPAALLSLLFHTVRSCVYMRALGEVVPRNDTNTCLAPFLPVECAHWQEPTQSSLDKWMPFPQNKKRVLHGKEHKQISFTSSFGVQQEALQKKEIKYRGAFLMFPKTYAFFFFFSQEEKELLLIVRKKKK